MASDPVTSLTSNSDAWDLRHGFGDRTITADDTLLSTDMGNMVVLDGTSNTVDLDLLPAASVAGQVVWVYALNISFACTVTPDGSETINGTGGAHTLTPVNTCKLLRSNGTAWQIISTAIAT